MTVDVVCWIDSSLVVKEVYDLQYGTVHFQISEPHHLEQVVLQICQKSHCGKK
jgi:hypothetical protein